MFGLGVTELFVILAIVLLLFGTKKLKSLGGDLGSAIKGFKSALSSDEESSEAEPRNVEPAKLEDAKSESLDATLDEKKVAADSKQNQT